MPLWRVSICLTERAETAVLRSWIMFEHSTCQKSVPFPCSQVVIYLLNPSEASLRFPERKFFSGVGLSLPHPTPTWSTRVSLFVWVITFDLSGLGDPASSCATAGLALRIIWPHKPNHYHKAGRSSGGCYILVDYFAYGQNLCFLYMDSVLEYTVVWWINGKNNACFWKSVLWKWYFCVSGGCKLRKLEQCLDVFTSSVHCHSCAWSWLGSIILELHHNE